MKKTMKRVLPVLALVLVVAVASVGGTIAWLTDTTSEVKNTFTVGNINIDLTETWNTDTNNDGKYDAWVGKIIPGTDLVKDPTVTVSANSEACWLFVKVTEQNWPVCLEDDGQTLKVRYEIDASWTALDATNYPGVYYREVPANNADQTFDVLKTLESDGATKYTVIVSEKLTKNEVDAMGDPTLTFKAYAIQQSSFATAQAAWVEVSK